MCLLKRETVLGAAESRAALVLLLGRVLTAEVACRGRWTFLHSAQSVTTADTTSTKEQTQAVALADLAEQAAEQWRQGDEAFKSGQ